MTVSRFLTYPSTPEEILSTRSSRMKAWRDAEIGLGVLRYDSCESSYIDPTEITGDTGIGLPVALASSF